VAETIFMIHGMWAGSWCWENYQGFFEDRGYHCVTTNLRFHDVDPRDAPDPRLGTTSLLDYAADLEEEIRRLRAEPILMGHSMGGLLAQILGSRGLGKALVLLTPPPPFGNAALLKPSVVKSFWSVQTTWGFWRKPGRQTFAEAAYSMLHLLPTDEQREAYDRFVYESGRAASEIGYWFLDANRAAKVDVSGVSCPVLFVAGAEDRIVPPSLVRWAAGRYGSRSTYRAFEGHAHWVVAEPGWQEIAQYVADWLERALPEEA
jgi:pimeloyl-ACP methyl ester carboxylesterase